MSYELSTVDREYYEGVAINPLHRSIDRALFSLHKAHYERELNVWVGVLGYCSVEMQAFELISDEIKSLLISIKKAELILQII